jgi:hypothetical protein
MSPTSIPLERLFATLVRRTTAFLSAGLCAGMLAGCSSTVAGEAVKEPESADSGGVNVAMLDTGPYPTHTGHPFGKAGNPIMGAYLEAVRMAEFVVGPWEVDATLRGIGLPTRPIPEPETLKPHLGAEASDAAAAHGFITAFATSRGLEAPGTEKGLLNIVMRFPDPDAASAAATEMAAATLQNEREPASIPRYPDTKASSEDNDYKGHLVIAFTAHGPYVFYQWASTKDRPEVAGQVIANTLDLQAPRIDDFSPTDPDKLTDLPMDPTGHLMATTMPPPNGQNPVAWTGVYQPRGALHFEPDPDETARLFTAAAIDMVAQRWESARVYQAGNENGAARFVNWFGQFMVENKGKPTTGINGLPDAKCFDQDAAIRGIRFVCAAAADHYAFVAIAGQETDTKQITAAQYRILAGK